MPGPEDSWPSAHPAPLFSMTLRYEELGGLPASRVRALWAQPAGRVRGLAHSRGLGGESPVPPGLCSLLRLQRQPRVADRGL